MLCKRADAFEAQGMDPARKRVVVSEDTIEKQKLFLESILVKRKVDELKSSTCQQKVFEDNRQRQKEIHKNKPLLGKRNFSELSASMTVDQLKEQLQERSNDSRRRLQRMRQICGQIEKQVKDSRGGLEDI